MVLPKSIAKDVTVPEELELNPSEPLVLYHDPEPDINALNTGDLLDWEPDLQRNEAAPDLIEDEEGNRRERLETGFQPDYSASDPETFPEMTRVWINYNRLQSTC